MRAAVVVFPGSNCDRDARIALARSTGREPVMVWHGEAELPAVDLIVLPGGFSYGDYLRPGAMAAHSPAMREVARQAKRGVAVLGICNGFQILTEAGLLPGALMRNAGLRFVCKEVWLRIEAEATPFAAGCAPGRALRLPVAHNEGNYQADRETLDRLEGDGRVAMRYCAPDGGRSAAANPNGSARDIAGVLDAGRRVLGMMPHPERLADPALGGTDGGLLLDGLAAALSGRAR